MRRALTLLRTITILSLALTILGPTSVYNLDSSATVVSAASAITEFPIPTANSQPQHIVSGPDGNLWFAETAAPRIGRITPGGQITEFTLPEGSNPHDITVGPDHNLWFTEISNKKIGRITPSGQITEFGGLTGVGWSIAAGYDGNLWFTEFFANRVARITPQGAVTEFPLPLNGSDVGRLPDGIIAGQNGTIAFVESAEGKIGQINYDGKFTEYGGLPPFSTPNSMAWFYGSHWDQGIWISDGSHAWVTAWFVEAWIEFGDAWNPRPIYLHGHPEGMTNDGKGLLWVTQDNDQISTITSGGTLTQYGGLTPGSLPAGITAGPDGNIWFTEFNGNRIGRLNPSLLSPPLARVTPPATIPGNKRRTFPETGKTVSNRFLDYWEKNGGLAQQGYPISDPFIEMSSVNGKPYTVQYFERAVFEYHPENKPPFDVLLSQLGKFQYQSKYPNGAPAQIPNTSPGSILFPQTGHHLGGKFLTYWQQHGGLAQQGYPITDEFQEKSDLDGKTYTVQYFERAVFEAHPENKPPYDVLLSQLGTFRYKQEYP